MFFFSFVSLFQANEEFSKQCLHVEMQFSNLAPFFVTMKSNGYTCIE